MLDFAGRRHATAAATAGEACTVTGLKANATKNRSGNLDLTGPQSSYATLC
jgi:hypothetical protein